MADIRINALATTAASTASDDFIAVDGSANGTRKLNAYSPTFGGNLTVSGTGNLGGGTAYATGVTVKPASNDYQVTLLQSNSNSAGWGLLADTSGNLKLTRYGASVYGTAALTFDLNGAATFSSSTTTTVGGNLTVSGTGTSSFAGIVYVSNTLAAKETNASLTLQPGPGTGGINYAFGQGTGDHVWYGGTTERMRLTYLGNLLIGTTNDAPNARLHVLGANNAGLRIDFGSYNYYSAYEHIFQAQSFGTIYGKFANTGNLLIGTAIDGGQKLQVNGSAALAGDLLISTNSVINFTVHDAYLRSAGGKSIFLQPAGTTALTLDSSLRCILAGALRLNNAYVAGAPTATGYVTLQDSAGNTYKVLVGT